MRKSISNVICFVISPAIARPTTQRNIVSPRIAFDVDFQIKSTCQLVTSAFSYLGYIMILSLKGAWVPAKHRYVSLILRELNTGH